MKKLFLLALSTIVLVGCSSAVDNKGPANATPGKKTQSTTQGMAAVPDEPA